MADLDSFDWTADAATLQAAVADLWPDLLGTGYADAGDLLPVTVRFDQANPAIQRVLTELAADLVGVSDTTRAEVQALVGQAAAAGWTGADLARQIRGLTEIAAGADASHVAARAQLIATTESARAYTLGARQAYADSGVVAAVEWLTTDAACDVCGPLDGQQAPLDGTFAGLLPPAHPACRCALLPVVSEDSNGPE